MCNFVQTLLCNLRSAILVAQSSLKSIEMLPPSGVVILSCNSGGPLVLSDDGWLKQMIGNNSFPLKHDDILVVLLPGAELNDCGMSLCVIQHISTIVGFGARRKDLVLL